MNLIFSCIFKQQFNSNANQVCVSFFEQHTLKWTPSKDGSQPVESEQVLPSAGLMWLSLSISMKPKYYLASNLSFSGCSHVGSPFTDKTEKGWLMTKCMQIPNIHVHNRDSSIGRVPDSGLKGASSGPGRSSGRTFCADSSLVPVRSTPFYCGGA